MLSGFAARTSLVFGFIYDICPLIGRERPACCLWISRGTHVFKGGKRRKKQKCEREEHSFWIGLNYLANGAR